MAKGDITLKLNAEGNAVRELGDLDKKLGGINTSMALVTTGALAVAAGIGKFVTDGIDAYSKFDAALTEINARTSLTDEEMQKVSATAKRLGIETAFSATDAANGILELITSGSDAEEALALIPDVLDLAAASGLDLETSADALTNVMKQFGLEASDSTEIIDTLVAASQSSSATVWDMVQAMSNGGVAASTYGLTLEQTAAALAVVAENGIKGAEAGTQLRSMLLQANRDTTKSEIALTELGKALWGAENGFEGLAASSEAYSEQSGPLDDPAISFFDDDGSARDFAEVMREIDQAMDNVSDADRTRFTKDLYGSFGQLAGAALDASGGIDDMTEKMQGANSAAVVADEQLQSYEKRVELLGSSLEGLFIETIGPFVETILQPAVGWITEILNAFTLWVADGQKVASMFQILSAFGTVMFSIISDGVGLVSSLLQGDFAQAWEYAKALVQRAALFIEGIWNTSYGAILTALADFMGGFIGGVLEGLDQVVRFFQTAFNTIQIFVLKIALNIVQVVENMINSVLEVIRKFLQETVMPLLAEGSRWDPSGTLARLHDTIRDATYKVDVTSGLSGRLAELQTYSPTGLGLGDDIRGRVSENIRNRGQELIDRGTEALDQARNVQVTNVNVEVGTNIGDNDELVRVIRDAARTGRLQ